MSLAKQSSKRKRRTQVVPMLGVAGLSLSLASGASAIGGAPTDLPTRNTAVSHPTAVQLPGARRSMVLKDQRFRGPRG